jgi:hypothetical protein
MGERDRADGGWKKMKSYLPLQLISKCTMLNERERKQDAEGQSLLSSPPPLTDVPLSNQSALSITTSHEIVIINQRIEKI